MDFSDNFIQDIKTTLNWCLISSNLSLNKNFIRDFKHKVNWKAVSSIRLFLKFIRDFQDKEKWKLISIKQNLSEDYSSFKTR